MLDKLRSEIEDAAFMLAGDADRKAIHGKLIRCLVLIDSIKVSEDQPAAVVDGESTIARNAVVERSAVAVQQPLVTRHHERGEVDERNKVVRRLKMWARRQEQYNSQILNAYLALARSGAQRITEDDIRSGVGDEPWFASNFIQMKVIADRNHGKVFDSDGYYVTIWEPVRSAVREYERIVFQSTQTVDADEVRLAPSIRETEDIGVSDMQNETLTNNRKFDHYSDDRMSNKRMPYTKDEIILCTFIVLFGRGRFTEETVSKFGQRPLSSVKMKVQNIAAMLDENRIPRSPEVSALTGLTTGESGRRTNWDIVEGLAFMEKDELWAKCKDILTHHE